MRVLGLIYILVGMAAQVEARELKVGENAPLFETQTHEGKPFKLSERRGQWTVLFFYPKAGTPGCTKQVCAFRDALKKVRDQGAEVFGISADNVAAQRSFHAEHNLNFPLLADADGIVIRDWGTAMPIVGMSKRWTFILDPELKIRAIEKDVDPVLDAVRVAAKLKELKAAK